MQQHNTWGKDRNDLASLASKVITEGYEDGEDKDAEYFAAHDELPESQDDLDRHEASKSEDAENSEIFELLQRAGELDANDMDTFLNGLTDMFDDPDVTDRAFELTRSHLADAADAFKSRSGN